ncbi:MAG TPA: glycine cleavage system protein GcvH [bacterium]|nr:glycine cleavage system protein GcvH [bacterium]
MEIKEGYFYTKEHEWVKIEGDTAKIGITDYAQHKLGDITFVEPPENGKEISAGSAVTGVESVKAASDIYSPISGKVSGFNEALENEPGLINESPYDSGWILEVKIKDESEKEKLLTAEAYREYTEGLE